MIRTEEYEFPYTYLDPFLEYVFYLLIFIRECLIKYDGFPWFCFRGLLPDTSEIDGFLVDGGYLVLRLCGVAIEKDDMFSHLHTEHPCDLCMECLISEDNIDGEWECHKESLHSLSCFCKFSIYIARELQEVEEHVPDEDDHERTSLDKEPIHDTEDINEWVLTDFLVF